VAAGTAIVGAGAGAAAAAAATASAPRASNEAHIRSAEGRPRCRPSSHSAVARRSRSGDV
jgi:hypothetical protein